MLQNPDSKVWHKIKLGAVMAAGLALAGCASDNPMDYLPEASGGYVGVNMMKMRESDGLKRLSDEMEKMQAGAGSFESDKAQKVYMAIDTPTGADNAPPMYGVAIGAPGFADEIVSEYKSHGASEGKTARMTTYTSGPVTIAPVGDTGILVFQDSAMLDKMVAVSKKKEPAARASGEFSYVESQLNDHALVSAAKAQPLLTLAGPMLTAFEAQNPQAVAALRQVNMVSFSFNWDAQPVIDLMLHLADKAQADVLAGTINGYLTMAKNLPMLTMNPAVNQVVQPLQATSAEDGVKMHLEIPAEVANQLFGQLQTMQQGGQQPGQVPAQQQQQQYQQQ
jgi:hypothetical protein